MIVRISSVIVPESRIRAYIEDARNRQIPMYGAAPGLVSVYFLQRPAVAYFELLTLSIWESERAAAHFTTSEEETSRSEHGAITLDPHWYELVLSCEHKAGG